MKKTLLVLAAASIGVFTGCEPFSNINPPRNTETMKENHLTTVTSSENSRAETYSEYISSLKEAQEQINQTSGTPENDGYYIISGGLVADTAVTAPPAEITEAQTAVSVHTMPVTEPPITEEEEEQTVTCSAETTPFPLYEIPIVPSEAVRADTALTTNQ